MVFDSFIRSKYHSLIKLIILLIMQDHIQDKSINENLCLQNVTKINNKNKLKIKNLK